jgi:hypothetical protein
MKMYLHPTPNTNLGSFEDSKTKLKEAVDLIPVFVKNDNLVYYPLYKLKNGRFMTYWEHEGNSKGFISDRNHNTFGSLDALFENNLYLDELARRLEYFEELLPKFHIKFKAQYSLPMAKLYTYGYLRMQDRLEIDYLEEFAFKRHHIHFERLQKAVLFAKNRLTQTLHNQIRDFGYSHNEFIEEVLVEYGRNNQAQPAKMFALVDEETFEYNLQKIFRKLCPKYIAQESEIEQLELAFSGSTEEIIPIKWVQQPNHLNYFLKGLKTRNKIANGNYFKLASNIFVDAYGSPFPNLKNNHSLPQFAIELDEIIDLF